MFVYTYWYMYICANIVYTYIWIALYFWAGKLDVTTLTANVCFHVFMFVHASILTHKLDILIYVCTLYTHSYVCGCIGTFNNVVTYKSLGTLMSIHITFTYVHKNTHLRKHVTYKHMYVLHVHLKTNSYMKQFIHMYICIP